MQFDTDIRVKDIRALYRNLPARYPLKFGKVIMDYILLTLVEVSAEDRKGKTARGYGSMPFAHMWGWPKSELEPWQKDLAMTQVLAEAVTIAKEIKEYLHPLRISRIVEEETLKGVKDRMPKLNALVSMSPLDAAIHDAYGRIAQRDVYTMYSKDFADDLSGWLGRRYKGKYISDYIKDAYTAIVPNFHLVGGLDPLTAEDVKKPIGDGLPETLGEWIERDGIYCLKIKWRGNDLEWDVRRALSICRIAQEKLPKKKKIYYTGDTNEQCESPDYMIELLTKIRERDEEMFDGILYIEQPTHRDIWAHPYDFSGLSKVKPVMMDESLVDIETFDKGIELGVSGMALKTCKGHSSALLCAAKCEEENIPYAVQDLSLPGLSFIHSACFAARIHTVMGVEGNGRQYFPHGSVHEKKVFPDIFQPKDGDISTAGVSGPGLAFPMEQLEENGFLDVFDEDCEKVIRQPKRSGGCP